MITWTCAKCGRGYKIPQKAEFFINASLAEDVLFSVGIDCPFCKHSEFVNENSFSLNKI